MDSKRDVYIEPFFGGGSIGLEFLKGNSIRKIKINDKDIGIASLWTAIIRHPQALKSSIMAFKPSTSHFYDFKDELTHIDSISYDERFVVDCGFKKLAIHQMSYSGLGTMSGGPLGGKDQGSNYKIDCRWSPEYICKRVDKLHNLFDRVEVDGGVCHCEDFGDILKNSKEDNIYYLDPPYYVQGNSLYQCGFSESDHKRLAKTIKGLKGEWVLSYDCCEEIMDLYGWACIEEIGVNYTISGSTQKSELLIHS